MAHNGRPTIAEEKLQTIGEGPSVEIERQVEAILKICEDGEVTPQELARLLVSTARIGLRNSNVRLIVAEGGGKVAPLAQI